MEGGCSLMHISGNVRVMKQHWNCLTDFPNHTDIY
jgi:hypothetical protein